MIVRITTQRPRPEPKEAPRSCRPAVPSFFDWMGERLADLFPTAKGTVAGIRQRRKRAPSVSPEFLEEPYWRKAGWKRIRYGFEGSFRAAGQEWQGRVQRTRFGDYELLIHRPPREMRSHSHWACFHARKDGWYWVHTNRPVRDDISSAILEVETLLEEALTAS